MESSSVTRDRDATASRGLDRIIYGRAWAAGACLAALVLQASAPEFFDGVEYSLALLCVAVSATVVGTAWAAVAGTVLGAWALVHSDAYARAEPLQAAIEFGLYAAIAAVVILMLGSRRQAVDRVHLASRRLAASLEAARMFAWHRPVDSDQIWLSDGLTHLLGLPERPGPLERAEFLSLIHPDDLGPVVEHVARLLDHGQDLDIEYRIVRPDGGVRHLISRGRVSYDPTGRPAALVGIIVDVTDARTRLPRTDAA